MVDASAASVSPRSSAAFSSIIGESELLALLMRQLVFLVVALVTALDHGTSGIALQVLFAGWAILRLCVPYRSRTWLLSDVAAVSIYITGLAWLGVGVSGQACTILAMVTAAGTTVISVGVATPVALSAAVTGWILAVLVVGCWQLGQQDPWSVFGIDLLPVQWALASAVRRLVSNASHVVDDAAQALTTARVEEQVTVERRRFEREQWAMLHDTAASTLLVVGQAAAPDAERIARQAQRDLAVLEAAPTRADHAESAELLALLRPVCAEAITPVRLSGVARLELPAALAGAVAAATREALTNVDRHAGADLVCIEVFATGVTILDDGVGFDPAASGIPDRHGVRRSILNRVHDAGGNATIDSTPGRGTTVRISWNAGASSTPGAMVFDPDPTSLVRGYGYGLAGVAAVLVLVGAPFALAAGPRLVQAALGLSALAIVAFIVLDIRRGLTKTRYGLVGSVCALGPVVTLSLPPPELIGPANWALGATGWLMAALLRHISPRSAITILVVAWLVEAAVVLTRSPTTETAILLGYNTAGITIVQALTIAFTGFMRRAAKRAALLHDEHAGLTSAGAVRSALHRDYERRYRDLASTTIPLLRALADRTCSVDDAHVQTKAMIEAIRLRRLFSQAESFEHPLLYDLRIAIDRAEIRGVAASFEVTGDLPDLDGAHRRAALTAPIAMVAAAQHKARVIVAATPTALTVSVVCDCPADTPTSDHLRPDEPELVATNVRKLGDMTWLEVRTPLP